MRDNIVVHNLRLNLTHLPSGMVGANAAKTMEEISETVDDEVEAMACKYFDGL